MTDITNPIYSDGNKAREHLEALHWPHGPVCPRCGTLDRITKLAGKSTRAGVYKCNECAKPFTVTVGTIFEDSKIPLNKWLLAFRLLNGAKKGFSAHELHRAIGITYKSAWFMMHRIREAMKDDGARKKANALFDSYFPDFAKVRHFAAHGSEMTRFPEDVAQHASNKIEIPGFAISSESSMTINGNLMGRTYVSTYEGSQVSYDLSAQNADRFDEILSERFRMFEPVSISI